LGADPAGLAFSIDITPTLYYLAGQHPTQASELFGRPLFTETAAERTRDRGAEYLLASSYGAVYAMLRDGGRQLYVADGVNYRDYLFDLDEKGASARVLDPRLDEQERGKIREGIGAIDRFYNFGNGGQP
jgi:arylsulfatase A-like enzyme